MMENRKVPPGGLVDRIIPGMAAGLLSGLFAGAIGGIICNCSASYTPPETIGPGVFVLEGATLGVMIGLVIAAFSYWNRNTSRTRWYWSLTAAAATILAVKLAENNFGEVLSGILAMGMVAAFTGWLVSHILLLTMKDRAWFRRRPQQTPTLMLYLGAFVLFVLIAYLDILLWSSAAAAFA